MADKFLRKDDPHSGCLPSLLIRFELDGEITVSRKPVQEFANQKRFLSEH